MSNKLFMISFITLFFSIKSLPSDDIWKQIKHALNSKSDINQIDNVNYFFFQEKNYCKRDIYSKDMKKLYDKQKEFFYKWNISNYIFVVDKFDENLESLEDGAFHLSQYLYNEFKVKMQYSILTIFSIQTRRVTIRTGEITKHNITDRDAADTISHLGKLLRKKKYYEAFLEYYNFLDFIIRLHNDSTFPKLVIAFLIFLYFRSIMTRNERESLSNDSRFQNIVSFLKSQKANKKIFEENCIICLNALKINIKKNIKEEKSNEIMMEKEELEPLIEKMDDSNNLIIKEEKDKKIVVKDEEGISTLNCGHQFHTECIIEWLKIKNSCPICRQIVLKENNFSKIVWNTQNELYPEYRHISYNYLYTNYMYPPAVSSSNYSSNYSYSGGFNFGGGATGGW